MCSLTPFALVSQKIQKTATAYTQIMMSNGGSCRQIGPEHAGLSTNTT